MRLKDSNLPEGYTLNRPTTEKPGSVEHGFFGECLAGLMRGGVRTLVTPAYLADITGEFLGIDFLEKAGEAGVTMGEDFIRSNPGLQRSQSITGDIRSNPQLWKDPNWYGSIVSEGLVSVLSMLIPGTAAFKIAKVAGASAKAARVARIGAGAGAAMGLEAGGQAAKIKAHEDTTGKEVSAGTKMATVAGTGVVAGALEYVPIFKIFGKPVGRKLVKRILEAMALEGSTEAAQEIVSNAFAKAGYDPNQDLIEGVIESAVGGTLVGGIAGGAAPVFTFQDHLDDVNLPHKIEGAINNVEKSEEEILEKLQKSTKDILADTIKSKKGAVGRDISAKPEPKYERLVKLQKGDYDTAKPAMQGKGQAGRESARTEEGAPAKTYFYEEGQQAEARFENQAYKKAVAVVDPSEIYNLEDDPKGLYAKYGVKDQVTELENAVKKAGYKGYRSSGVVAMFEETNLYPQKNYHVYVSPNADPDIIAQSKAEGQDVGNLERVLELHKTHKDQDIGNLVSKDLESAFEHPLLNVKNINLGEGRYQSHREVALDIEVEAGDLQTLKAASAKFAKQYKQFSVLISEEVAPSAYADPQQWRSGKPEGMARNQEPSVYIEFDQELSPIELEKAYKILSDKGLDGSTYLPKQNAIVIQHVPEWTEAGRYVNAIETALPEIFDVAPCQIKPRWFKSETIEHNWSDDITGKEYTKLIEAPDILETRAKKAPAKAKEKKTWEMTQEEYMGTKPVVAVKTADGKVYKGKPGDMHFNVYEQLPAGKSSGFESGWWADGKFYKHADAIPGITHPGESIRANELAKMEWGNAVLEAHTKGETIPPKVLKQYNAWIDKMPVREGKRWIRSAQSGHITSELAPPKIKAKVAGPRRAIEGVDIPDAKKAAMLAKKLGLVWESYAPEGYAGAGYMFSATEKANPVFKGRETSISVKDLKELPGKVKDKIKEFGGKPVAQQSVAQPVEAKAMYKGNEIVDQFYHEGTDTTYSFQKKGKHFGIFTHARVTNPQYKTKGKPVHSVERTGLSEAEAKKVWGQYKKDFAQTSKSKLPHPAEATIERTYGLEKQNRGEYTYDTKKATIGMFAGLPHGSGTLLRKIGTAWDQKAGRPFIDWVKQTLNNRITNERIRYAFGMGRDQGFKTMLREYKRDLATLWNQTKDLGVSLAKIAPTKLEQRRLMQIIRGSITTKLDPKAVESVKDIREIFVKLNEQFEGYGLRQYSRFDKLTRKERAELRRLVHGIDPIEVSDPDKLRAYATQAGIDFKAKDSVAILQSNIQEAQKVAAKRVSDYYHFGSTEEYAPLMYSKYEGPTPAQAKIIKEEISRLKVMSRKGLPEGKQELEEVISGLESIISKKTSLGRRKNALKMDLGSTHHRMDLSPEVQRLIGLIEEAPYPVAKGMGLQRSDIRKMKLLKAIADNPAWAMKPTKKLPKPANYVQVSGKEYGPLNGMAVRKDIWDDLAEVNDIRGAFVKHWDQYLAYWKYGKVVINPATQARNIFSNTILAYWGDVMPWDQKTYRAAAKAMKNKLEDPKYKELYDWGLYNDNRYHAEIKNLSTELTEVRDPTAMKKWWRKAMSLPGDLYSGSERFYKTAVAIKARADGMSVDEACRKAEKFIFNYSDIPPVLRHYKRWCSPFATFTFKATPLFGEMCIRKPWKVASILGLMYGLEEYARHTWGDDEEEWKQKRALLPEWQQKRLPPGFGPYGHVSLPWADKWGNKLTWDLTYALPFGGLGETWGQSDLTFRDVLPNHPLMTTFVKWYANVDPFLGREISDKVLDDAVTHYRKLLDHLYRDMMPSLAPGIPGVTEGGYSYTKLKAGLLNIWKDKPELDWAERPVQLTNAMLDALLGMKLRPANYKKLQQSELYLRKQVIKHSATAINRLNRDYDRNKISKQEYKKKYNAIARNRQKILELRSERTGL